MKLIIDTRESGSVAFELDKLGTPYEIRPLSVGDFIIESAEDVQVAVFERKTCADLAASINDGRYNEQKGRLKTLSAVPWIGYIFEGYYPVNGISFPRGGGKRGVVPRSTVDSVKMGLTLRDEFKVFEMADAQHTAIFLTKMLSKIPEYLKETSETQRAKYDDSLIKSLSTVRKENMTPELCYLSQLCQIPGISHGIAQAIQLNFSTIWELLKEIQEPNAVFKLSMIKCSESRKLGNVLAQRIVEYMGPTPSSTATVPVSALKVKPVIKPKAPISDS